MFSKWTTPTGAACIYRERIAILTNTQLADQFGIVESLADLYEYERETIVRILVFLAVESSLTASGSYYTFFQEALSAIQNHADAQVAAIAVDLQDKVEEMKSSLSTHVHADWRSSIFPVADAYRLVAIAAFGALMLQ